jgi:hypothetical protein
MREEDARSRAFVMMHLEERKIGNAACPKNFVFRGTRHVDRECGHSLIYLFSTAAPL